MKRRPADFRLPSKPGRIDLLLTQALYSLADLFRRTAHCVEWMARCSDYRHVPPFDEFIAFVECPAFYGAVWTNGLGNPPHIWAYIDTRVHPISGEKEYRLQWHDVNDQHTRSTPWVDQYQYKREYHACPIWVKGFRHRD
jgi:hypothetical protein